MPFLHYTPDVATVAELGSDHLAEAAGQLAASGRRVYGLIQGYPYSGLVRFVDTAAQFPPGWSMELTAGNLTQFWDLRLFNGLAEIRFTRSSGRWTRRVFTPDNSPAESPQRRYPLWGTLQRHESTWDLYSETGRGIEVWVPEELTNHAKLAILTARLIPAQDADSGLAQYVDMIIEKIEGTDKWQ